jgi:predicted TIM-barrel fold metal-dependent hydrolase
MSMPTSNPRVAQYVRETPVIDTHEHLIEESRRLKPPIEGDRHFCCLDWAYLFVHYAADDLACAGMLQDEYKRLFSTRVEPREKWRIFQPYFDRARNTGYIRAALIAMHELYGVEKLDESTVEVVTERMRAMATQKGFYRKILKEHARIESCQVNSLEKWFCETEYPELLMQDLSLIPMCINIDAQMGGRGPRISETAGIEPSSLSNWHRIIAWWFDKYGRQAIAVKNQGAYQRRLDFAQVSKADAEPLFARHAKGEKLNDGELKALQDHLFHYCVEKAVEYDLPVKLHTGYYVSNNSMPLSRVGNNAADMCDVMKAHPNAKFVLMHIGYPYQDQMISLAKQYTNAYVDMCWAWIINPVACVRFLKEALAAAPAHKFFCFGGDYFTVEPVVGHAAIARQGVTQALSELIDEGWTTESEAVELAARIMHKNARELYRLPAAT